MKFDINTTRFVIASTVMYTVSLLVTIFYQFSGMTMGKPFFLFSEIAYIIPIFYMTSILSHLHERRSIIIVYIIYMVFDVGFACYFIFLPPTQNVVLSHLLTRISGIMVTLMIVIYSLRIQTRPIGAPFSIYWIVLLAVLFIKFIGLLFLIQRWSVIIFKLGTLAELVLPICLFNVWLKAFSYLKDEKELNSSISKFGTHD